MQPLDLVSAAPWQRVIFTTYALSLSFFEAVVLDRLVRGGGRNTLILSDPEGIRAGLSEQGARRAGRDYELEPVANTLGAFHPKLSLFLNGDDTHMLIGSGNLTLGGWGMNFETIDHIHPSFAAEAFDETAVLFEKMAGADNIRTGVKNEFYLIAEQIRISTKNASRKGCFRLLHGMTNSIAEQITQISDDLGGATRLTVISPYYDKNGRAVSQLSEMLRCSDVRLHAHPNGSIRSLKSVSWPEPDCGTPICIDTPFGDDERHLHAKCIEVMCRRGRLLVSGSANATYAALFKGNVEASLARIQREVLVGWNARPVDRPAAYFVEEEVENNDDKYRVGILRAELDGDLITGEFISSPILAGTARASVTTAKGKIDLGITQVDNEGKFTISAPDLEAQSWGDNRTILSITSSGKVWEGFVSLAAAAKIIQKAGAIARHFLALLSGTDMPQDLAAIFSWLKANPSAIVSVLPSVAHSNTGSISQPNPIWVPIASLTVEQQRPNNILEVTSGNDDPGWLRALWLVRSAFTNSRGQWNTPTVEQEVEDSDGRKTAIQISKRIDGETQAKSQAMNVFEDLLDDMLSATHKGAHIDTAFDMAHYLTDRIRPAPTIVKTWIERIGRAIVSQNLPASAAIATAFLLLHDLDKYPFPAERARKFLIRAHVNPATLIADCDSVRAFIDVLDPTWIASSFLQSVKKVKTAGEEVRNYLAASENGLALPNLPILKNSPHWAYLEEAFHDPALRSHFIILERHQDSCPRCSKLLPAAFRDELRTEGVTKHCRIILSREE